MPTVDDYAPLAPFTIDELVGAINSIFRDRRRLHVQPRTVRYYISKGLLPPPSGGPKFARYGLDHLERLVSIRTWLDEGVSLEEAMVRLGGQPSPKAQTARCVRENRVPYEARQVRREDGQVVRRIRLSPTCVLEVDANEDVGEQIRSILPILDKMGQ